MKTLPQPDWRALRATACLLVLWCTVACERAHEPKEASSAEPAPSPLIAEDDRPATPVHPEAIRGGPALSVAGAPHHDFGPIREVDGDVAHTFTVKNVSGAALDFSIQSSCTCLVAEAARSRLAADEETTVVAVFLPRNRQGDFDHKSITLQPSQKGLSSLRLTVSARVIPRLGIDPPGLNFGEASPGEAMEDRRVVLTSRGPGFESGPSRWTKMGRSPGARSTRSAPPSTARLSISLPSRPDSPGVCDSATTRPWSSSRRTTARAR
ncbi:MAG: DUF1573 domain-containing protein [Planctomycetes bacterium]|nr:DUF1573 domain-containing protein [Planctomycetota bacterium]